MSQKSDRRRPSASKAKADKKHSAKKPIGKPAEAGKSPNTKRANTRTRKRPAPSLRTGPNKQPAKCANRGQSEAKALKCKQAFELRAKRFSYRQIAEKLGVNVKTAFEYVNEYWKVLSEDIKEQAEMVKAIELDALDKLQERWEPLALSDALDISSEKVTGSGDVIHIEMSAYDAGLKAVDRLLKIMDRRAQLMGLDAPKAIIDKTPAKPKASMADLANDINGFVSPLLAGIVAGARGSEAM